MSRVVLLIIFGLTAAMYFPDSRQAIVDKAMPVLTPLLKRAAAGEMRQISDELFRYDQIGRALPTRREWLGWLEANYDSESTLDPWGKVYQFYAWSDSFAIISYGPDMERGNEDDVRLTRQRRSWRRRR